MSMMHQLAIIIAHYNDPDGLATSLGSISDQEPADVIVVDDGSQQPLALADLRGRLLSVHRLELIRLPHNSGPARARNRGMQLCVERGYAYIAIFDCGDVSHPDRFRLQREYLAEHPDIALVGSAAEFYTETGRFMFCYRPATADHRIRRSMYYYNQFVNSSMMFKTSALATTGLYPLEYAILEDYPFAFRFVRLLQTANIARPLLRVVATAGGISTRWFRRQKLDALRTIVDNFDPDYLFPFALGALKYAASFALGVTIHRWLLRVYGMIDCRHAEPIPFVQPIADAGRRPSCDEPVGGTHRAGRDKLTITRG